MELKQIKSEGLAHTFEAVIAAPTVDAYVDARLKALQSTATATGFRPGKVPLSIVQKKHGAQARADAVDYFAREAARSALEGQPLGAATQPQCTLQVNEPGQDLKIAVYVEFFPQIPNADLSKIKLDRFQVKVAEKDINDALVELMSLVTPTQTLSTPRKTKTGDRLLVSTQVFEGKDATGPQLVQAQVENKIWALGAGSLLPDLESQLLGQEVPGTITAHLTLPADFHDRTLAGKEIFSVIQVAELREPTEEMQADDVFAQKVGFESLDALKASLEEGVRKHYAGMSFSHLKRCLFDALDPVNRFDVPPSLVQQEMRTIWRNHQKAVAAGQPALDTEEALQEKYQMLAQRRVRLGLFLAHVGRENNVQVSDADLEAAVKEKMATYADGGQGLLKFYQSNPRALEDVRTPLFEDAIVHHLVGKMAVNDVEIGPEALEKALDALSDDIR